MKKILFGIICLFLSITLVEAKEYCTVVSGNGKDIGSEIACGDEHFYVIDNDGTNTKMLAKYNLYVGLEINQVGPTFDDVWEADSYCYNLKDYDSVAVWPSLSEPGKYYCHTEKELEYDEVRQSSEAIGLTMKDNKYVIQQIGIVYMTNQYNEFNGDDIDENGNSDLRYTEIQDYLDEYKSLLQDDGYSIKKIELIKLEGFNKLIKETSGKELELGLDGNKIDLAENDLWEQIGTDDVELIHINIKDYISEEFGWIDSTTYWIGSSLVERHSYEDYDNYDYYDIFMTTLGDLCAVNRGCSGFAKFGAGIRPVVTIANKDISYIIETKTDGNGTVKASKSTSNGGEEIAFEITPNKGYVLSEVKVTDSEGNIVTFTDYKFTMPNANVLIEATFVPTNPNTKTFLTIIPIIVFIVSALVYFKTKTFNY